MMPPTSIDGTDITGATIDGQDVEEITVDGQTVFTAGIPDRDVYLHDDFEDGKLQNRDDSDTTTFNGVTGTYRPEWTLDNGSPSVTNGRLDYSEGESGFTTIDLNLSNTITWTLSNVTVNSADNQKSFVGLFYENNPSRSTSNFPPTLFPGYAVSMRTPSGGPLIRLIRVDSASSKTDLIEATQVTVNMSSITIERSPSGDWTLSIEGSEVGTATDNTYTNPQYIDFAGRSGGSDNQLLVDELKVN